MKAYPDNVSSLIHKRIDEYVSALEDRILFKEENKEYRERLFLFGQRFTQSKLRSSH